MKLTYAEHLNPFGKLNLAFNEWLLYAIPYDWKSIGIFHLNSKSQTKRKCVFFRFSFHFHLRRSHENRNLIIMSRVISKEIDLIAWQRTTGNPFFTWNMSGGIPSTKFMLNGFSTWSTCQGFYKHYKNVLGVPRHKCWNIVENWPHSSNSLTECISQVEKSTMHTFRTMCMYMCIQFVCYFSANICSNSHINIDENCGFIWIFGRFAL